MRKPRGTNIFCSTNKYRGLAILLCLSITETLASDIGAFKLTDLSGELALRYLFDEQSFSTSGVKVQQDTRPTFQEEYRINTRSYVYHPNMLTMDVGGSFLLDQSRYETLTSENSNNEELLSFNAQLDFLNKKPYPVSLFYDKQNPSVTTGLGGRFIQENIKYGINLALLQPITPVRVSLNAYRQTSQGEGFDQLTDDELEHMNLRLYRAYGSGDHAQLSYQINNRDSRSGSPNLPIQSRQTNTTSTYFDSKNLFGNQRQVQLASNISYSTQDEFPKRRELRANPVVNWRHSQKLNSFYRFNYTDSKEETIQINNKNFTSGIGYSSQRYSGSMDIHGEDSNATGIDFQNTGFNVQLSHNRPVALGELKLSYSGSVDYRDQNSESALFDIFGEQHELSGTTAMTLSREFIDSSSIVVSNAGRTQIYVDGLDYRILLIGAQTQIQRLAAGNILDAQTVLVDYSYQTGGSFKYDLINNSLQLNWNPSRYYELYIRYRDSQQNLSDGNPSVQLNSVTRVTYGASVDKPMLNGIKLGGEAYTVDHEEDINPFTQQNYDAYIDLPLPRLTNLRLSARRQLIDNQNSIEDVNLTGYILRLRSRPWLRTRLSYESSYENDTGGSLEQLLKIQRLQLNWTYRQLSLSADAHYSAEEQGVVKRERWAIKLNLRRTF
jgi:hypothetical protein